MHHEPAYRLPAHLPERLSISFWLWDWLVMAQPGEPYADLERAMQELTARGFNAIRVEVGPNWCFRPDGTPRGEVAFGQFIPLQYSRNFRCCNVTGGGRFNVLASVMRLMDLAQRHGVYVIVTSWEYMDSNSFLIDSRLRDEIEAIPESERFLHLARQHDRLLVRLKQRGLAQNIAFVEIHNEFDWSRFPQGNEGKFQHEEALAFLRDRHPDILFAADFSNPKTFADLAGSVPANTQVLDQHMYFGCDFFFQAVLGQTINDPAFDPRDPGKVKALQTLLKPTIIPFDEIVNSAPHVREMWARICWLFANLDNARYDAWVLSLLPEWEAQLKQLAAHWFAGAAAEAARRRIPAVLDEQGFFVSPQDSRWEETPTGLAYYEHMADLAIRHGYWGFMPMTYSGPECPIWQENPDWLRAINGRFQQRRATDQGAL